MKTLRTTASLTGLALSLPVIATSIPATRATLDVFGGTDTAAVLLLMIGAALILAIAAATPGARLCARSCMPVARHTRHALSTHRDIAGPLALVLAVIAIAVVTTVAASRAPELRVIVVPLSGESAPVARPAVRA